MRSNISVGIATMGYQYYIDGIDPETIIIDSILEIDIEDEEIQIDIFDQDIAIELEDSDIEVEMEDE